MPSFIRSYKRLFAVAGLLVVLSITSLAFITHSTCACGDKVEKSLLRIIIETILR